MESREKELERKIAEQDNELKMLKMQQKLDEQTEELEGLKHITELQTRDERRLIGWIRREEFSAVLSRIIIKVVLSSLYLYGFGTAERFAVNVLTFLGIYFLCTLFGYALKLTGNYLVAIFAFFIMLIGGSAAVTVVESLLSGQASALFGILLVGLVLLGPIIYDITKAVRIVKNR